MGWPFVRISHLLTFLEYLTTQMSEKRCDEEWLVGFNFDGFYSLLVCVDLEALPTRLRVSFYFNYSNTHAALLTADSCYPCPYFYFTPKFQFPLPHHHILHFHFHHQLTISNSFNNIPSISLHFSQHSRLHSLCNVICLSLNTYGPLSVKFCFWMNDD